VIEDVSAASSVVHDVTHAEAEADMGGADARRTTVRAQAEESG
jgi:hypothetical protein